ARRCIRTGTGGAKRRVVARARGRDLPAARVLALPRTARRLGGPVGRNAQLRRTPGGLMRKVAGLPRGRVAIARTRSETHAMSLEDGPLVAADESLTHQIVETHARVAHADRSWTEK